MRNGLMTLALLALFVPAGYAQAESAQDRFFSLSILGGFAGDGMTHVATPSTVVLTTRNGPLQSSVAFYGMDSQGGLYFLGLGSTNADGSCERPVDVPASVPIQWLEVAAVYWDYKGLIKVSNVLNIHLLP